MRHDALARQVFDAVPVSMAVLDAASHLRLVNSAWQQFGRDNGGQQFPLDYLKIDIEFVSDAAVDPASRHVIEAVVSLAASFGLHTVAEGVEDQATLDLLTQMGVDRAQGYLLGRPAPASATLPTSDRTDQP